MPDRAECAADVHISVVSHADQSLVRRCLRSLPSACEGISWEATAVENLPRVGPPLTDDFPWVRVLANSTPAGFGQNHNEVLLPIAHQHLARYILVLNDDTELAPESVAALVRHADRDTGLGATGPILEYADGKRQHSLYTFPTVRGSVLAALRPGLLTCDPIDSGTGWLGGACLLVRSEAVRAIGLFDPRFFMFFEDTDLCARLSASGWRIDVCPEATVVHFDHQTVSLPGLRHAMQCQMLRSSSIYFELHGGPVQARTVSLACRFALFARGIWMLFGSALLRHGADERRAGWDLLRLARYSPTAPLQHERPLPST